MAGIQPETRLAVRCCGVARYGTNKSALNSMSSQIFTAFLLAFKKCIYISQIEADISNNSSLAYF